MMSIKNRIATLEKAILDKLQSSNHMTEMHNFTPEDRRKVLDSCFGGKYEEVMQELHQCKNREERSLIYNKYAIRSVKEALLLDSSIKILNDKRGM